MRVHLPHDVSGVRRDTSADVSAKSGCRFTVPETSHMGGGAVSDRCVNGKACCRQACMVHHIFFTLLGLHNSISVLLFACKKYRIDCLT